MDQSRKFEDDVNDEVGQFLKKFNQIERWVKEKHTLNTEMIKLLKKKRYIEFSGSPYRYGLQRIGESYLYDVPINQRGNLEKFSGKRIRIVCVLSGRYSRWLMAGVVK